MKASPIQILPVHRVIKRVFPHGLPEAFPGKHADGLLLEPHPKDEVVKDDIHGRSRAFREPCPGEQGLYANLAPEGGKEIVDQESSLIEEVSGEGWKFDCFRGTIHSRRSLGVGVNFNYPTLYSL
jgi:hypothetical protein